MPMAPAIADLLRSIRDTTGFDVLSEAKVRRLDADAAEVVTVVDGDEIVAVGVAAPHPQVDGTSHWSVETAVTPGLQFGRFEGSVLDAALATVPTAGGGLSVWSSRPSLDAALEERGFAPVRSLRHMTVDLPLASHADGTASGTVIRPADDGDLEAILAVNRRAFADHREAVSLARDDIERHRGQAWFRPPNLVVAEGPDGVGGFCWTKVHPNGDGEIYRIAVDPDRHGEGLGRRLVEAGFAYLAGRGDVTRGTLWVDGGNTAAIGLYESIGMRTDRVNVEFERAQPKR